MESKVVFSSLSGNVSASPSTVYDGNIVGVSSDGFESIVEVFVSDAVAVKSKTVWVFEAAALQSST